MTTHSERVRFEGRVYAPVLPREGTTPLPIEVVRAAQREGELLHALSALVRAYDHPPDGTAHGRMRAAIAQARELLGLAPVHGVDGEPA